MAEGCPHVRQVQLAVDKPFLNPRSWACNECGFTDSVWACLLCSNVACGRTNFRHALKHFEQTKHPLAVEVNRRYVHCYLCDDYVLNDNISEDIRLIQSLLSQVASQHYVGSYTRSGRLMKPAQSLYKRSESKVEVAIDNAADRRYTALCHWRYLLLFRAFNTWRVYVDSTRQVRPSVKVATPIIGKRKRRLITPGMTGLRNLGNTCYMNAVLQSLGHIVILRECFRHLLPETPPPSSRVPYLRQTTIECFNRLKSRPVCGRGRSRRKATGLVGGQGGRSSSRQSVTMNNDETPPCLCAEMHALVRVMWSGKWAVVTPHAVLNAVWQLLPSFHGYSQHDAQEFLCEFLDQLQSELEAWPSHSSLLPSHMDTLPHKLLPSLFQGKLISKVCYKGCGHHSTTEELFWDLSLEFPPMYQDLPHNKSHQSVSCNLQDILEHFTSAEDLEGQIYCCDHCRHSNQYANKRLLISQCPDVIRLHLKRFRWRGRTRHKINVPVRFPLELDMSHYCTDNSMTSSSFKLSSVIVHHGVGFQSGHYTAYCWNSEAGSWVHCNDARLTRCSIDEVFQAQAYILFYIRDRQRTVLFDETLFKGVDSIDEEIPSTKKRKQLV